MNEAPDFLIEEAEKNQPSCDLKRLAEMVDALTLVEQEIAELDKKLKEAKAVKVRLSQEAIPEYLNQYGISEIKLADGRKVNVKDDVSVTIKDQDKFYYWLKQRREDDIIKLTVRFDRMDPDKKEKLFECILENELMCSQAEKIEAQTQKKYFKELLGIGKESETIAEGLRSGLIVQPEEVEDFAKVFSFKTTKIK